jgi:hypothetical protein
MRRAAITTNSIAETACVRCAPLPHGACRSVRERSLGG